MIEIKSKKTGRTEIMSENQYALIKANPTLRDKYIVTSINMKSVIPDIKLPEEIKLKKKKE